MSEQTVKQSYWFTKMFLIGLVIVAIGAIILSVNTVKTSINRYKCTGLVDFKNIKSIGQTY